MRSITELALNTLVVDYPVANVDYAVVFLGVADDNGRNTCIDDKSLAHTAAGGVFNKRAACGIDTYHVKSGIEHLVAGGGDDGVSLRMNGSTELVSLTAGNVELFADAEFKIAAVFATSGRTVVSCRDDGVVFNYDSTEMLAKAGSALSNGLRNIEIIIGL